MKHSTAVALADLKSLQSATNRILTDPALPNGANRADLRCADVREWRSVYGDTGLTVVISEASPFAAELQGYVAEALMAEFGVAVEVETDW